LAIETFSDFILDNTYKEASYGLIIAREFF